MSQPRQLPVPVAENWDWQLQGSCRSHDADAFFYDEGERGRARHMREQRAKQICASCPVIERCRAHALAAGEPYGVWGGLTEAERASIIDDMRQGRRNLRLATADIAASYRPIRQSRTSSQARRNSRTAYLPTARV